MDAIAQIQPDGRPRNNLGPLIARRKRGIFERLVYLVVLSLFAAIPGMGLAAALFDPNISARDIAAICAVCLPLLGLCLWGMWGLFRVIDFHHNGAVERCFHKRRTFQYEDAKALTYSLTRQYYHGIYCGTTLVMRVRTLDGRKFKLDTRHKEQARGLAAISMGGTFEGEDEMDDIRDLISAHIAARLTKQLEATGTLKWNRKALLTADGIMPSSGRYKNQLLRWPELAGVSVQGNYLHVMVRDRRRSILTIAATSSNFYAFLQVLQTLAACASESRPVQRAA